MGSFGLFAQKEVLCLGFEAPICVIEQYRQKKEGEVPGEGSAVLLVLQSWWPYIVHGRWVPQTARVSVLLAFRWDPGPVRSRDVNR